MIEFNSLKKFANYLNKLTKTYENYEKLTSEIFGLALVEKAKDKIGHLQPQAGEFSAWAPLAESTKKDKELKGYVFNDEYNPLYRTGELKDSISSVYNKNTRTLFLGSTSDIMVYQELGTEYIPPRSVIGASMFEGVIPAKSIYLEMMKRWFESKPITKNILPTHMINK